MANLVETQRVRVNRNAWKANVTKEIIELEDNLDQLYQAVGLKPHRIVHEEFNDVSNGLVLNNKKSVANSKKETRDYQNVINEQVENVRLATNNICNLLSSVTEFDLPVPVYILLRIAVRMNSIRWLDFRKKMTGSLAKQYVYANSVDLISSSLTLFKCISTVIGTNIIPFQPFINGNILSLLEWTRTSDLLKHNQYQYFALRSQIFNYILLNIELLSLNMNLEPKQLENLIQIELLDSVDEVVSNEERRVPTELVLPEIIGDSSLKDRYLVDAFACLERLFLIYAEYLAAPLESSLKSYVMQTSLGIYRDFERNVIGLAPRRQLIRLVEAIASQPFATSTTELAWHILELAERMETDPEIRYLTRRSMKAGLAHRPILISHHDVYNCYSKPLLNKRDETPLMDIDYTKESLEDRTESFEEPDGDRTEIFVDDKQPIAAKLASIEPTTSPDEETECNEKQESSRDQPIETESLAESCPKSPPEEQGDEIEQRQQQQQQQQQNGQDNKESTDLVECPAECEEDDADVQLCMSLFVDKPADDNAPSLGKNNIAE